MSAYPLGDSPAEIRHLVEQAAVYAPEANELFDLIGVEPGIAAIDVGCGVMGVLHLLAERIGTSGRVVGLEREPRILEEDAALPNNGAWKSSSLRRTPPQAACPRMPMTLCTHAPCC